MTFRHRAGVSPYTSSYDLAETCVFGKQSLGPIHCGPLGLRAQALHPTGAPLIPKLRGNFAEFLNEGFLDRLGILYPPTCVGFGTGTRNLPRGFSRGHGFRDFRRYVTASCLSLDGRFSPGRPTQLPQHNQRLGSLVLPRPPIGDNGSDVVREYQPVVHRLRLSASA